METSPRIGLAYLSPQQSQKHVTVNESLRLLDALVQLTVQSAMVLVEPASPAEGQVYILPLGASGANWSAYAVGSLAVFQDGSWAEIAPGQGWRAWVNDEARLKVYDSGAWSDVATDGGESAAKFGVNTIADAANRLAVKSDAVLLSHDDVTPGSGEYTDCLQQRPAESRIPPHFLFQAGFSARAEFGLVRRR